MRHRAMNVLTIVAICMVVTVSPAIDAGATERVNQDDGNVAIRGYDTVAYFTEGRPVEGTPEFEHVWRDARWRFSSAEHLGVFAEDPERYAPRYGGFCAGAMARGWRVTVDPEAWTIIDGRLYLLYASHRVEGFVENSDEEIPMADANWERLGQVE